MRRPCFSLKALLVLVGAVCVWFGWWASSSKHQQRAVEFVLRRNGDVAYSFNRRPNNQPPPPPDWMMWPACRDYFFPVVGIGIREEVAFSEEDLQVLGSLPEVADLQLHGPRFTDGAVDYILKLKHLRCVTLSNTGITDSGLTRLAATTRLKEIGLYNNATTDHGVEKLQRALPHCKLLR